MQIIKISFGTILILTILYFTAKFYGLGQAYAPFNHPFVKTDRPWIAVECTDELCINQLSAEPKYLMAIHLTYSNLKSSLEIKGVKELFEDFINEKSGHNFLILVDDNIKDIDLMIDAKVRKLKKTDNILIHSQFDNVITSLKKLQPNLVYGTGAGQKARLIMLESLGLPGTPEMSGDFLLSQINEGRVKYVTPGLVNEIARRRKDLFLGPLTSESEIIDAIRLKPSGYLTKDLVLAKKVVELLGQNR